MRITMKKQAFNPYLPSYEYIPDGEPRVFGDRVYVYGSHDKFNASIFCVGDYICYSAPVDDLSDWRYEGVIFKKNQDTMNKSGLRLLFAPDVVCGTDGRYYLYYAYDFLGAIGVAVCDTPAGEYQFYGHVHYADGTIWGRKKGDQFPFDPGVLVDDDGEVYLYSGFYTHMPAILSGFHNLRNDGGVVVGLESDMVTIKKEPKLLFPKQGAGSFPNHEFFEASSIRKDGDTYIFVYSSRHNHELCYATSKYPDRDFSFGGTLVDLGDMFLEKDGQPANLDESKAKNYLGNTHGGMLKIGEQWYIFYHRQTNRHSYSRQACAEKLIRRKDGSFVQAEVTSSGLNDGPLIAKGHYEARIACNLWSGQGTARYDGLFPRLALRKHPYFTQAGKDREENGDQYIANMQDGAVAGFKYFSFEQEVSIILELSGNGQGVIQVFCDEELSHVCGEIEVILSGEKAFVQGMLDIVEGVYPLYFKYLGSGYINFHGLTFTEK